MIGCVVRHAARRAGVDQLGACGQVKVAVAHEAGAGLQMVVLDQAAGSDVVGTIHHEVGGDGAVWAVDPDGSVARLDPRSGRFVATVAANVTTFAAGAEGVWVLNGTRVA